MNGNKKKKAQTEQLGIVIFFKKGTKKEIKQPYKRNAIRDNEMFFR